MRILVECSKLEAASLQDLHPKWRAPHPAGGVQAVAIKAATARG